MKSSPRPPRPAVGAVQVAVSGVHVEIPPTTAPPLHGIHTATG
jgi:hypothetical protein